MSAELRHLIEQGTMAPRLWFYTNYHCNLACDYCLTGSSPRAKRRILEPDRILRGAASGPFLQISFGKIVRTKCWDYEMGSRCAVVRSRPDFIFRLS